MTAQTMRAYGAGWGQALLFRLAASLLVFVYLCVCLAGASLVPLPRGVDREFAFLGAFILGILGALVTGLAAAVWLVVRRDLVVRLTTPAGTPAFEFRQVILQPESLLLRLRFTQTGLINSDNVRTWLADLQALLRRAEAEPPPTVTAEATGLERSVRLDRGRSFLPVLLIGLGLVFGTLLCGVGLTVAILLLSNGP